ncbi:unnamed protein product [Colias eurytheme]|nr:unnamed protein product [Colias eurytheme]
MSPQRLIPTANPDNTFIKSHFTRDAHNPKLLMRERIIAAVRQHLVTRSLFLFSIVYKYIAVSAALAPTFGTCPYTQNWRPPPVAAREKRALSNKEQKQ